MHFLSFAFGDLGLSGTEFDITSARNLRYSILRPEIEVSSRNDSHKHALGFNLFALICSRGISNSIKTHEIKLVFTGKLISCIRF
jgi:hypothetical protein